MARKAHDAEPEGPGEGAGEAPEKAPREAVAECCGTTWYSLNAWDAHSRSRNHKTFLPPTLPKGARATADDLDADPEILELRRQVRLKTLRDQLEGGPSRSDTPAWVEKILDRLERLERDGGRRQDADPVALATSMVTAIASAMKNATPQAEASPLLAKVSQEVAELRSLSLADARMSDRSAIMEALHKEQKAFREELLARVQPPSEPVALRENQQVIDAAREAAVIVTNHMDKRFDKIEPFLRPVMQGVGRLVDRAIEAPPERPLSDADREMGERAYAEEYPPPPPEDRPLPEGTTPPHEPRVKEM